MADFRAIEAVGEALVQVLRLSYDADDFDGHGLQVLAYTAQQFAQPMTAGASLFLYRVRVNGAHRTPCGRLGPDGRRALTRLPLDLHYLLTAWAQDASLQHRIVGWAMRALEDTPILPYGFLESVAPEVFEPDEALEVILDDLPTEDLVRVWESLGQHVGYRVSVPYLVRNVRIDSRLSTSSGPSVQERLMRYELLSLSPADHRRAP